MLAQTHPEDSVLFLVDGSLGDCNSSAILRAVLNSVAKTIQNWLVREDSRYEVSVVVFNAEISFADNSRANHILVPSESPDNLAPVVLMRFDRPHANDMLKLLWLGAELEDCDGDGHPLLDGLIKPRFNRLGLQDGLQSALAQFETLNADSKTHRRLLLITKNQNIPPKAVKLSLVVEHLVDKRVEIVPLPISQDRGDTITNFWKELFDQNFFYNTDLDGDGSNGIRWGTSMVGSKSSVQAVLQPLIMRPDEANWKERLLIAVQNAAERKRPIFRAQLVLGDLKIGISGYQMAAYVPSLSNYAADSDQDMVECSYNESAEAPEEQNFEDVGLVDEAGLGLDKLTMLYNIYANPTEKIIVKSFINVWNMPNYAQYGNALLITASDFQLAQSHRAFNSLHRSMVRSRRVAEVVWYKRCDPKKNLQLPVLGYLLAFNPREEDDYETVLEGNEKLRSASCKTGFVFIPTPSLEELQLYNHDRGKELDVSVLKPEMRAILKCFWSSQSYTPDIFPHPILQQTARILEYLGLQLGTKDSLAELVAIQDCTVPDYTFLKSYMASENAIERYLQKASKIQFIPCDDIPQLPQYLPSAIEHSLREQDDRLSSDDLELLVSLLVGQERWQKWIDRPPQTIRTFMYNYLKLYGLDCLIETVQCPQMIHDLVRFSSLQSRIADIPLAYKILVCMMYEKSLPETEKELRKIIQSIFTKSVKRPRDKNDQDDAASAQKTAKTSQNQPLANADPTEKVTNTASLVIPPVLSPGSTTAIASNASYNTLSPDNVKLLSFRKLYPDSHPVSGVEPFNPELPSIVRPNVAATLPESLPPTEIPHDASLHINASSVEPAALTQQSPRAMRRQGSHERQPSISAYMSSLHMTQQSEPVSFLPSTLQNEASPSPLESQAIAGSMPFPLEASSSSNHSLILPSAVSVNESPIPETATSRSTEILEISSTPVIQQSAIYRHADSTSTTSGQSDLNSGPDLARNPSYDVKESYLSNRSRLLRETSIPESSSEREQRPTSAQLCSSQALRLPPVVQPTRPNSPVPEGPHYIPLPWMRAVAFSTWYTELLPYDQIMLAELFGVDNRNPATVEHHLSTFFRNELNRRKAARIYDHTNRTRYVSEKTLLFEFLNTTPAPKRLHDYVKEAFWRENNSDGSYRLTGIMLRTVSRMYGLPTNAPMPDIVRRLRKVFGGPIIGNANVPEPKDNSPAEIEVISSSSDEDDFSFKKNLPTGVSAREHRRMMRQQRMESSSSAGADFTGIERLRHIITPRERSSLNRELISAIDSGDLVSLPAAQLQFICKRLRLRNDGSRTVLIDRIKSELGI